MWMGGLAGGAVMLFAGIAGLFALRGCEPAGPVCRETIIKQEPGAHCKPNCQQLELEPNALAICRCVLTYCQPETVEPGR